MPRTTARKIRQVIAAESERRAREDAARAEAAAIERRVIDSGRLERRDAERAARPGWCVLRQGALLTPTGTWLKPERSDLTGRPRKRPAEESAAVLSEDDAAELADELGGAAVLVADVAVTDAGVWAVRPLDSW